MLTSAGEETEAASEDRTEPFTYTVRPGDQVRHIAKWFGLQTMTVVWNNDLPNPDLIFPGDELLILPVDGVMVEVQPGDTLNNLATTYGTSTTAIINYEPNGIIDPDVIQPGQKLILPGGVPPRQERATEEHGTATGQESDSLDVAPESETGTSEEPDVTAEQTDAGEDVHADSIELQPGDTLAHVAQRFGVTIDELARANQISDIDVIQSGDVLYLPNGESEEVVNETETIDEEVVSEEASTEPESTPAPAATAEPDPTPAPAPQATATPEPQPTATAEPDPTPEPESQQAAKPSDIPGLLEYYANQYGLDPNLVKALAWVESGWNQSARNPSGATGVMQIMPGTATWIDNNLIDRKIDIYNSAEDNIHAGTAYLHHMIEISGGVERGLASYLRGPGNVQRSGINETARQYIDTVMRIRDHLATHGEPPR
jgi:peptidoglycan DL-endopeptidase CwlS